MMMGGGPGGTGGGNSLSMKVNLSHGSPPGKFGLRTYACSTSFTLRNNSWLVNGFCK
jgi:hypothetical protein